MVAVLLLGACPKNGTKETTPVEVDGLPCGLTPERSLAPAADSSFLQTLDRHRAEGTAQDLSGEDLTGHCQQLWQDVIEGGHCSTVVGELCESGACATEEAQEACTSGRPHDRAIVQCLDQTLPVFRERYAPCEAFTPPK